MSSNIIVFQPLPAAAPEVGAVLIKNEDNPSCFSKLYKADVPECAGCTFKIACEAHLKAHPLPKLVGQLTCPECKFNGSQDESQRTDAAFLYIEDEPVFRRVLGLDGFGKVIVSDTLTEADGVEGVNARMQCCHCFHEFPIPGEIDVELDYVNEYEEYKP